MGLPKILLPRPRSSTTANLYWQLADSTGEAERLTDSENSQYPSSWHPSGKLLAFGKFNAQTGSDIMILPMEGDDASGWKPGKPWVFLNGLFWETAPMYSPDGLRLAYHSNESGRNEVYVQSFPGPPSLALRRDLPEDLDRRRGRAFERNVKPW